MALAEEVRDAWLWRWIDAASRDVKHALRSLRRNPAFTTTAIVTLALGIAATTIVFSVVNSVLLRPLPFSEPDRVVRLALTRRTIQNGVRFTAFVPSEDDWPVRQRVFEDILGYGWEGFYLTGGDQSVRGFGLNVPIHFTRFVGVEPWMGRGFLPGDVTHPASVALVSYGFWRDRLGSDPAAIGRKIQTDDRVLTVIGVMPKGFRFEARGALEPAVMWMPEDPVRLGTDLARLRPGVSVETAQAELTAILRGLRAEYPGSPETTIRVVPLTEDIVSADWAQVLTVFSGAVAFLLAIAIANVANLSLARGVGRERELAIRSALGSSRIGLVRHLLVESVTLSTIGGAAGVVAAWWGVSILVGWLPPQFPRVREIGVDLSVLGFAVAAVLVTGIACGIVPALGYSGVAPERALKDGGRGATDSRWRGHLRSALVAGQVSLAVILSTGGLLMARGFADLVNTPLGMDVGNVILVSPRFLSSYTTTRAFFDELSGRLLPRTDVANVSVSRFDGMGISESAYLTINGRAVQTNDDATPYITGDPEIFDVLGIEIVNGRAYRADEQDAVVVTESFAARHYAERNPLGQQLENGPDTLSIVGVARDFRLEGPQDEPIPAVISPRGFFAPITLLVRVTGDPGFVMDAIRSEVRAIDPGIVVEVRTLEEELYGLEAVSRPRLRTALLGGFAAVALILAIVGLASVTAYSASRRRQEIGIRMALGGTRGGILGGMLLQAMTPVVLGILVGALGSAALSRVLSAYLGDLGPFDAAWFGAAALTLLIAAAAASWAPLWRSTKISPTEALRYE